MELWIFDKKRGHRSIMSTSGDAHPLAPLPGADSPYQGEMSRRDKRGRDAGSAQPRLRGCHKFARKPKPRVSLAVWKGRNEHRGKETSLAAARSVVVVSDAPPAAPSFPSCRKRRGRKGALGYGLVLPASAFRQETIFQASFRSRATSRATYYAPPDTGVPNLQLVAVEYLLKIEGAGRICRSAPFCIGFHYLLCTL